MSELVMPRLSDSMTEGTVVRWLKQPGQTVARGEPIVEIETDKATITYESDVDGVLTQILVGEGQTVPVGTQIALIGQGADAVAQQPYAQQPVADQSGVQQPVQQYAPPLAPQQPVAQGTDDSRVKASPIARRLAKKLGVDLTTVAGSGPGGRIVKEDVEAAANAAAGGLSADVAPQPAYEAPPVYEQQPPAPLPLPPDAGEPPQYEQLAPAFEPAPALPPEPALVSEPYAPPIPGPGPIPVVQQPYAPPQPGQPTGFPPALPPVPGAQPFPSPPAFVPGMTGGFPAIQPGGYPPPAPAPAPAPATSATATRGQSTTTDLTGPQQTVARRMAESKATAPEFFVEVDVDMTTAVAYREQMRMSVQPLPSYNDFVIKAVAQTLRQLPKVNGAYKDGRFEQYSDINVGFVVAAGEILSVPTVFAADQKGLSQIARETVELAAAVRGRTIQPAQLSGGTFSISNLGMYGVDRFTAILNPPQAAILAVGAIKRRVIVAEDGMTPTIRQMMTLTLSCDHRILYGAEGAEFLMAVKAWLESPQALPV